MCFPAEYVRSRIDALDAAVTAVPGGPPPALDAAAADAATLLLQQRQLSLTDAATLASLRAEAESLLAAAAERDALRVEVAALATQLAALTPSPGSVVPVGEFAARLVPLQICLAAGVRADGMTPLHPDGLAKLREKWDRLVGMLRGWSAVDLTDPRLGLLAGMAAADGLLTPDQAGAVTAVGP